MRISTSSVLLAVIALSTQVHGKQQCVTEGRPEPGRALETVINPAQTVTLVQAAAAVQPQATKALRVAEATPTTAAVTALAAATTITKTAKAVASTTTLFVTTGPPGGTTTITSYTLNVPAPSLARPALQRRREYNAPARLSSVERDGEDDLTLHVRQDNTRLSNGVDNARFKQNDDNPNHDQGRPPRVYCHDIVTQTVKATASPAPLAARAPLLGILGPKNDGAVTVTVTPTNVVTKTSSVPAPPTATAIVGGLDVCKPSKFSELYDWTAYQAEALAFGITTFSNITDPASCCAASANVPGALAFAVCNPDNNYHDSCTVAGGGDKCFVTYLKTIDGYTSADAQCVAGSDTSTFQYRTGRGQTGGPLQCASTYEPYKCVRPVLGLLGDLVCNPAK
ncbi:hypothetical protein V8E36_009030 [Tilletia maclaganii]